MTRDTTLRCLLAALGGALLFAADYPIGKPWLELLAFAPLLWVVLDAPSPSRACLYAACWGVGRTAPLAFMLRGFALPIPAALALAAYVLGLDILFGLLLFRLRTARSWVFALAAASSFVALELVDSLLPMWGTARTIARAWVDLPTLTGLVRLGGTSALAFVVVLVQALLVMGVRRREKRTIALACMTLAGALGLSWMHRPSAPITLKTAAIGWGLESHAADAESLVAEAASRGARLVVLPETAFEVLPKAQNEFAARWSRVAREHHVFLVVSFSDRDRPGSRLVVFDSSGNTLGEYLKHHLVPLAEPSPSGDRSLLTFDVDGVRVGTMICQDDNFADIARAYARLGTQLLVVPTFEGPPEVAPYHFRDSVLRTIENPIALVRAAAQGESAAIAPGGFVVERFDHARKGVGIVVADVPIGSPGG